VKDFWSSKGFFGMGTASFRLGAMSATREHRVIRQARRSDAPVVKLWQFDPADRKEVKLNTVDMAYRAAATDRASSHFRCSAIKAKT
jgi:hypothetical protein